MSQRLQWPTRLHHCLQNATRAGMGSIIGLALGVVAQEPPVSQAGRTASVRFAMTADIHSRIGSSHAEAQIGAFTAVMREWQPDFVVDLGDFAIQMAEGQTTPELHDGQLENLKGNLDLFSELPCPSYLVLGNHDVGWLKGGDEQLTPADLYRGGHGGEDITKAEHMATAGTPGRYYSFEVKGVHFVVLDGNNWRGATAVAAGHDGVPGAYWIDDAQKAWLAADLAAHRGELKVVFCHQELHHTPVAGSSEGGDVPFPAVGKEGSYIDNGWEVRELLAADGQVVACFSGHKHRSRRAVYGGVNYITLAALHSGGSFAKVTLSDVLHIEGVGNQSSYTIPLP